MNDLISRPALLEVLEGFKLSLGDIFFRMIVDRVIERIREQPAVKLGTEKIDGLHRCPFCGGKATVMQIPNSDLWAVGCNDDQMCMGNINHVTMVFCTKENAVRAWNRRVPYGKKQTH